MKKLILIFLILTLASLVKNDVYLCERDGTNVGMKFFEEVIGNDPWYDDMSFVVDEVEPVFDSVIPFVLEHEGSRFVRDTTINEVSRRGITLTTYKQYYGKGDINSIRNLTEEQATAIYKKLFWENHSLDSIVAIGYPKTAIVLMDSQINIGPHRANKFLQRIVAVPYEKRTGRIDSLTLDYIDFVDMSDEDLAKSLIRERRSYYSRLVAKNDVYSKYHRGWNNRLNSMSRFIKEI